MNPIEMMWHELKTHIRRRVKPSNKEELVNCISDFWSMVEYHKCTKYINHLQNVLPMVVERQGKASGHW